MKKTLFVALLFIATLHLSAQEMLVGTYNIRYKNLNDSVQGDQWPKRCQVICDQVNFMSPVIFGAQEVLHGQLQDLLKALGWLFGFVLVQDSLFTLLNALLFARRSNRKGWWLLIVFAIVLMALGVLIFLNPWWDSPTLLMRIIGGALLFSAFVSTLRLIWVWPFKNGKESAEDASER